MIIMPSSLQGQNHEIELREDGDRRPIFSQKGETTEKSPPNISPGRQPVQGALFSGCWRAVPLKLPPKATGRCYTDNAQH